MRCTSKRSVIRGRCFALGAASTLAGCRAPALPRAGALVPERVQVEPVLVSPPDVRFDGSIRIASIFPTVGRDAHIARGLVADQRRRSVSLGVGRYVTVSVKETA